MFQILFLFGTLAVIPPSTSVVAERITLRLNNYVVEDDIPEYDLVEDVELERMSYSYPGYEKKSARHYENYAHFVDNPFAHKHQPHPHYTRYHYPYDPYHNPHQYAPEEHYPVHAVKHHSIHLRN